jgi:hypothetical protein
MLSVYRLRFLFLPFSLLQGYPDFFAQLAVYRIRGVPFAACIFEHQHMAWPESPFTAVADRQVDFTAKDNDSLLPGRGVPAFG